LTNANSKELKLASSINASLSAGVVTTADTSGVLNIQTAGTTAIAIDASQAVTMAGRTTNPTTISVGAATPSASGAGITFPATQSASTDANTLDDYEEGTFTPTAASNTGSITAYISAGIYVKIGKLVFIQGYITTTTAGTAGGIMILAGFPFSVNGIAGNEGSIAFYGRESQMTGTNFGGYTNGSTGAYLSQPNNGAMSWGNGYIYPFAFTCTTI